MQNRVKNTILNSITETAVHFLEDDMRVKVLESVELEDVEVKEYYSAVNFSGETDLTTLCFIDKELLEAIYRVFIPYALNTSETQEMLQEMPNETINIIAGLSISKFPKPYNNLSMSPPSSMDKKEMQCMLSETAYIGKEIRTDRGSLQCILIG